MFEFLDSQIFTDRIVITYVLDFKLRFISSDWLLEWIFRVEMSFTHIG